jgi:diadenosine tetraphosphate (Ap4A) HIT family hydrolase
VNVGRAAGQTIGHAHLHLIPRHWGDVPDPRGGIRCLIPEPTRYRPVGERGDQR